VGRRRRSATLAAARDAGGRTEDLPQGLGANNEVQEASEAKMLTWSTAAAKRTEGVAG